MGNIQDYFYDVNKHKVKCIGEWTDNKMYEWNLLFKTELAENSVTIDKSRFNIK